MADLAAMADWHRRLADAADQHRSVAALEIAADRAGVEDERFPGIRARIAAQRDWFAEATTRAGVPAPALVPDHGDVARAGASLGDFSTPAVAAALDAAKSTLDTIDTQLLTLLGRAAPTLPTPPAAPQAVVPPQASPPPASPSPIVSPPPPSIATWPAPIRNGLVYAGYAFLVLLFQLILLFTLDDAALPLTAPFCLFVLPAFAWIAGWLTIGMVFRSAPGAAPVRRSPRLGALVCASPDLMLCGALGVLYLLR